MSRCSARVLGLAAAVLVSAAGVAQQACAQASPRTAGRATAPLATTQDLMETVDRWNAVADAMPVDLPPPFGPVMFHWDGFRFPHPTFKGGSAEAYAGFGKVLAAFLGDPQTFEFLAKRGMFTANLRSGVPGGANGPDQGWSFVELAAQFQRAGPLGAQDEITRASLRTAYERIRAIETARPRQRSSR